MEAEIINKVANSGLVSIDLEEFYPNIEVEEFDIAPMLWQGLILKEKEFREALKNTDWSQLKGKTVAIHCSADAIVPTWAFMLVSIHLSQYGIKHQFGHAKDLILNAFRENIEQIDFEAFRDKKIVVKGCSKKEVPLEIYVELTRKLFNVCQSIMFGEPCSTVPLWKKPKNL